MIHRNHCIEILVIPTAKKAIRRIRTINEFSAFEMRLNRRHNQRRLLFAQQAIVARVRIQTQNSNARLEDIELNAIANARQGQKIVPVKLDEL